MKQKTFHKAMVRFKKDFPNLPFSYGHYPTVEIDRVTFAFDPFLQTKCFSLQVENCEDVYKLLRQELENRGIIE